MKRLLTSTTALAGLAALCVAGSATAQVTGTVGMDGTVADRCLFVSNGATIALNELSKRTGASAEIGRLEPTVVNTATARLNGWCNGTAATMSVEALPLLNTAFTGSPPTGFARRINYTATATASPDSGDVSASDTSLTEGSGASTTVGIFASDIRLAFSAAATPSDARLVAGPYAASVLVTLTPLATPPQAGGL
jgi:hypothetical protein